MSEAPLRRETLASLLTEVRACQRCAAHLPHGPRPVLQLHSDARILIAGQAPGRKVHASGLPFDDASGNRLRTWLDVDREAFYDPKKFAILPMGLCFPGTGPSGDLPPRPECAPTWRERLLQQAPNVQLTLVIGQYALAWHLPNRGKDSLTQIVVGWREAGPHLLPLPHPSPRNNRWFKTNPWFDSDVVPWLKNRVTQILSV